MNRPPPIAPSEKAVREPPLHVHAGFLVPVSSPPIVNGHLVIDNGLITHIGSGTPPKGNFKTLDLSDFVVTPGLINAHCHLELTSIGTLNVPRSDSFFVDWISKLLPAKMAQTEHDLDASITQGLLRLARSGVTAVADHVSPTTPLRLYQARTQRLALFGEVLGLDRDRAQEALNYFSTPGVSPSPHAVYSLHPDILKQMLTNARQPISIHLDESLEERLLFQRQDGPFARFLSGLESLDHLKPVSSALRHLKNLGLPLNQVIAVHANCLENDDLDLLRECRGVVHCPGSHAYFEHPVFPIEQILSMGVPIALGTDSLTSNQDLSLLSEMRLLRERLPSLTAERILQMATKDAAQILGWNDTGELTKGMRADLAAYPIKNNDPFASVFDAHHATRVFSNGIEIPI